MKTTTVTYLRRNVRRVLAWIEAGQPVDITKRGRVVARLIPPPKIVKPDFMAQLKEVWGDRMFTEEEVKAMRDFEREGEQG